MSWFAGELVTQAQVYDVFEGLAGDVAAEVVYEYLGAAGGLRGAGG